MDKVALRLKPHGRQANQLDPVGRNVFTISKMHGCRSTHSHDLALSHATKCFGALCTATSKLFRGVHAHNTEKGQQTFSALTGIIHFLCPVQLFQHGGAPVSSAATASPYSTQQPMPPPPPLDYGSGGDGISSGPVNTLDEPVLVRRPCMWHPFHQRRFLRRQLPCKALRCCKPGHCRFSCRGPLLTLSSALMWVLASASWLPQAR